MNRCPITYESCGDQLYSAKGLKLLSQYLDHLEPFDYTAEEQRTEAQKRAVKISIQGVQPKLSAVVNIKDQRFELIDKEGKFILKPQHPTYPQLPENEDVTMRMAEAAGISAPLHGLIRSKDQSLTYFIKRFDRAGHKDRIPVEDFAQLASLSRETKYNYTMEKAVVLLDSYCTFPMIEKAKFFLDSSGCWRLSRRTKFLSAYLNILKLSTSSFAVPPSARSGRGPLPAASASRQRYWDFPLRRPGPSRTSGRQDPPAF